MEQRTDEIRCSEKDRVGSAPALTTRFEVGAGAYLAPIDLENQATRSGITKNDLAP
jgi:hypothetical protein